MKTSLFSFDLPEHLIAQSPPPIRGESRLMLLQKESKLGKVAHRNIQEIASLLKKETLMVFNNTKVRKARFFASKADTSARGEFLFLHPLPNGDWVCLVDKAKKKKVGQEWIFPGNVLGLITEELDSQRRTLRLDPLPTEDWFEQNGHIPLPPYLRRPDEPEDAKRYQTVYAQHLGSAAAPTAGLHFTSEILDSLKQNGIHLTWLTLNVGFGTFAPIRTDLITDHVMHTEEYHVPETTAQAVNQAKQSGQTILSVGTTSLRTLEAAWDGKKLRSGRGTTNLFIYPGYEFQVVDSLFTNFHTPCSSLLMLVSAFAGRERIMHAYEMAMRKEYRFFSYGDAMLIS